MVRDIHLFILQQSQFLLFYSSKQHKIPLRPSSKHYWIRIYIKKGSAIFFCVNVSLYVHIRVYMPQFINFCG